MRDVGISIKYKGDKTMKHKIKYVVFSLIVVLISVNTMAYGHA